MADIELVIKIPENLYKATINGLDANEIWDLRLAVKNGTPLPKGHGRLIDADAVIKKMEKREERLKDDKSLLELVAVETALDMFAPTIIEQDKVEREG